MSSLLDRIHAAESCLVQGCTRHRLEGASVCKRHLDDLWANRLDRLPDGTFAERRRFVARELEVVA